MFPSPRCGIQSLLFPSMCRLGFFQSQRDSEPGSDLFRVWPFRARLGLFRARAVLGRARIHSEPDDSELGSDLAELVLFRARIRLFPSLPNPS